MVDREGPALTSVDGVFAPPAEPWVRVSPKLITARRLVLALTISPIVAILVAITWVTPAPGWVPALIAVIGLVIFVWAWWLIGRRVRSYGYCERTDDLLVTSGILFRRLVIVPYGRMQLVDVTAGPIDRWLGITTVQLHTAAATSDAAIPGLTPADAAELRDRLSAVGEQRSAGL
ncbi:MAG: PH domain-containing protein [Jiangellales bacterium]